MDRRDFIKMASMAGLGVVSGATFMGQSKADAPFAGPYFFMVACNGGWHPWTFYGIDNPGNGPMDPDRSENYTAADRIPVGNFMVAPSLSGSGSNEAFFKKFVNQLCLIHCDNETNNHDAGNRAAMSGLLMENKAVLAALVAATHGPTAPMSFLSAGGSDSTGGLVAKSSLGNTGALKRIAYPTKINPDDPDSALYHSEAGMALIQKTRDERLKAMQAATSLPRISQRMGLLYTARYGQNELAKLADLLPDPQTFQGKSNMYKQAAIAVAAMRAGVCVAAQLSTGGFDTHSDHDNQQQQALDELFQGVSESWDEAEAYAETKGNTRWLIGSDFGRTFGYNDGNGKDHYQITAMLAMGVGIPGNKVIGKVTANPKEHKYDLSPIDPNTLALSPGGVNLKPAHIHDAFRKLYGVKPELANQAPLDITESVNLFGG
jgi:hypothetical protein